MWIITTQSSQNNNDSEDFKSYGSLIASIIENIGQLLKSLMVFVMLHQTQNNNNNNNNNNPK